MDSAQPAKDHKIQILVTDVSTYLGSAISESFLLQNCSVFGVGKKPLYEDLIDKDNFTLLQLDLSQPLPSHLPQFDFVFYTNFLSLDGSHSIAPSSLSALQSFASQAIENTKVYVFSSVTQDTSFFERTTRPQRQGYLKLVLVGDLYGPKMPLEQAKNRQNELPGLLYQAVKTDKVILENEGLRLIYPTYITDAVFAVHKFVFSPSEKDILYVCDDDPKTALSVAYEIQNALNITAGKNIGLFFSGPEASSKQYQQEFQKIHPDFSPKVNLAEGLKNTLEYFFKEKLIEDTPTHKVEPITHAGSRILQKEDQVQKEQLRSPQSKKLKFPLFQFNSKLKSSILGVLVILLLIVAKTGLDVFLGIQSLKSSQEALHSADFDKAQEKAEKAGSSFKAASNKTKILTLPFSLVFQSTSETINNTLLSASVGSSSFRYFSQGSQQLAKNYEIIISKKDGQEKLDLDAAAVNFEKAFFLASEATELANLESQNIPYLSDFIVKNRDNLKTLSNISSSLLEISLLTNDITGLGEDKTYLVLLQNNAELRPGGGFIGNYGLIEFSGGYLKSISVDDVYNIDGQLKEEIEPPPQLKEKLGVEKLYLRDSNWSLDFNLNSKTARDFFKKETGKDVDGVIALDLTLMQKLLEKIGPLKLEDYQEEITAENLFERGQYYSEVGFFPGSTQKKDFFSALARRIVDKFTKDAKSVSWPQIANVIKEGLPQKHLMFTFDDSKLFALIQTHGWDHPSPPKNFDPGDNSTETRDFIALSEANVGANKVNRFIERKVSYHQTIGRDADLVGKLTITYVNKSEAETWPAGKYINYLRVYVPAGSDLIEIKNGENSDLESVQITNQGSMGTFATYVEVPVRSTKEVTFTYKIPKNINLENAPTYHLYIQKQPGTLSDPLEFTFNLPSYLAEKDTGKQNLKFTTDLATDREFKIEIAKK